MTLIVSTLVSFPAHADFWSRLRDAAVSAVGTVVTVATSTVAKVGTALGIGQCKERSAHGIDTYCFNSAENNKIIAGLDALKSYPFYVQFKGKSIDAQSETLSKTKRIINFTSTTARAMFPQTLLAGCKNNKSNYGCHSYGVTGIAAKGLTLDKVAMSAFLFHEVGHYEGKSHTCGYAADKDLKGPYAMEAYYMMGQFHNGLLKLALGNYLKGDVSFGEGLVGLDRAISIATYQMCNNQANLIAILSYAPQYSK